MNLLKPEIRPAGSETTISVVEDVDEYDSVSSPRLTVRWTGQQMDGWTDQQTDTVSFRAAYSRLKTSLHQAIA